MFLKEYFFLSNIYLGRHFFCKFPKISIKTYIWFMVHKRFWFCTVYNFGCNTVPNACTSQIKGVGQKWGFNSFLKYNYFTFRNFLQNWKIFLRSEIIVSQRWQGFGNRDLYWNLKRHNFSHKKAKLEVSRRLEKL